jgi:hypothetical protein
LIAFFWREMPIKGSVFSGNVLQSDFKHISALAAFVLYLFPLSQPQLLRFVKPGGRR